MKNKHGVDVSQKRKKEISLTISFCIRYRDSYVGTDIEKRQMLKIDFLVVMYVWSVVNTRSEKEVSCDWLCYLIFYTARMSSKRNISVCKVRAEIKCCKKIFSILTSLRSTKFESK